MPLERGAQPLAAEGQRARRHLIADRDFDDLASGIDDGAVVRRLRIVERSYRNLELRALLDVGRGEASVTAQLPPLDAAWDLLVAAERLSPSSVAALLDRPQTGSWAARALRRIVTGLHDDVPLWVDLGYLHCLAVSAAISAGVRFELQVPLRRGFLHVPALGSTRIGDPEGWGVATVSSNGRSVQAVCVGQAVRLPVGSADWSAGGSASWDLPVRLRVQHRGRDLDLTLDSVDPFRSCGTTALPEFLGLTLTKHWKAQLQAAWTVLVDQNEKAALAVAESVTSLVPLPRAPRFRERSSSSADSFGGVVLSLPDDPVQFAATLVHEAQHAKLGVLLHVLPLLRDDGRELVYAPWRDDPRPVQGLFQGIFAHFGVAAFWRSRRVKATGAEAATADFEFALWRDKVSSALKLARERPEFTVLGQRFLTGMATTVAGWLNEPVAPQYGQLAELAIRDHEVAWRIHHLMPQEALVRELAAAWHAGTEPSDLPAAQPSRLVPDRTARDLDARQVLIRYWLAERGAFRRLEQAGDHVGRHVAGATVADLRLVAGRSTEALELYLGELERPAPRTAAWPGLGLALPSRDDHRSMAAARAMLTRPEYVRAVWHAVERAGWARPPVLDLAAWLGAMPVPAETEAKTSQRRDGPRRPSGPR